MSMTGALSAEEAVHGFRKPARSCGIDDVCGFIRPGYDADFIVTKNLQLEETFMVERVSTRLNL